MGGSRLESAGDIDSNPNRPMKMIAAPAKTTQGAAAPLTSVAPITTTSAPRRRNLGHQRVRRVRTRRAPLWRAGLPGGAAGRPNAPGTGATGPSLSRCRGRTVITSSSWCRSAPG